MQRIEQLESLCALYTSECEVDESDLYALIDTWLTLYNRVEKRHDSENFNTMQYFGKILCCICTDVKHDEFKDLMLSEFVYDIDFCVVSASTRVCMLSWEDLQDIIYNLQKSFETIFVPLQDSNDSEDGQNAFSCSEDIVRLCLVIMSRAGYFASNVFEPANQNSDGDTENYAHFELRAHSGQKTYQLSEISLREFLDNLHAVLGFARLLLDSKVLNCVEKHENVKLQVCHREASLDDFYNLSMISDLHPGAITFYSNKYPHLFHSVSQVIYYNMPSYHRQKQIPLQELQQCGAPHINLLPLLQQLNPDIAILYEHTGAGSLEHHSKHDFALVVFSKFVVLVDSGMRAWWHSDLTEMFSFLVGSATLH